VILAASRDALQAALTPWRDAGERLALVATMGNLHQGHLKLVHEARAHAQRVAVSIFVNPLQFGANEDFHGYPRTLQDDRQRLLEAGVDLLFAPGVTEIYPRGQAGHCLVMVPLLSEQLCGQSRPGHFSGVATVVCKLLNLLQPEVALFGEKDYQQLLVIRRMVADLAMPVRLVGVPTVREADGLAMSSRNRYLDAGERRQAPALYATLCSLGEALRQGQRDYLALERQGMERLGAAGFAADYVSVRRAQDLQPPGPDDNALVVLAAARLGNARLIDNLQLNLE
jgi:pantoate--beta-alanine ligase